jgi:hypothetical protein
MSWCDAFLWAGLQPDALSSKAEALPTRIFKRIESLWVGLQPDAISRKAFALPTRMGRNELQVDAARRPAITV